MIIEGGHFALIIALVASLSLLGSTAYGLWQRQEAILRLAPLLQWVSSLAVVIAFIALIHAFIVSDFSVALVVEHSHQDKPMLYKIAGVWGNHEGSLLLWVVVLALYGTAFSLTQRDIPLYFRASVLMIHAGNTSAFAAFSLFTSNPFLRLDPAPLSGNGLNPVLQDIGLALHPPVLYLGYVGLALAFAFAVAGLIEGRIDRQWGRWIRPWIAVSWSFLTAGIVLGSWWAYYELGWGGWWFWDPVENASLMPWLVTTALLHSVIVVEKRQTCQSWAVLLAILGFSLSLLGTFIVRSGLLTSVHSFANDPARGVFILSILIVAIGLPLVLYAFNGARLSQHRPTSLISRDTALIINNFLLLCATGIVLLGTFYPLGLEMFTGLKISVGPPFFDATFLPLMALGMIGMVIGAGLVWRRGVKPALRSMIAACAVASIASLAWAFGVGYRDAASMAGIAVLVWLITGIFSDIVLIIRQKLQKKSVAVRPMLGMWLGHFGVAFIVLGGLGEGLGQTSAIVRVKPQQSFMLGQQQVLFDGFSQQNIDNYQSLQARLIITTPKQQRYVLVPERRFYPVEQQHTTEAAISSHWWGDYYAVLGDINPDAGFSFRVYKKPLINSLWLGGVLLVLAGLCAALFRTPIKQSTIQNRAQSNKCDNRQNFGA